MLASEIRESKQSGTVNDKPGANFVSSLQKANVTHNFKHCHWLEQCYEVDISPKTKDSDLILPIDGGSDAGMFCVVGTHFDPARIIYHSPKSHATPDVKPGDIILAINGYEISGYTKRDAVSLCSIALKTQLPVRVHFSPPHALATGNTMLSSFLAASFSLDSPEYALQEKIRENVYQRVVPCE